MTNFRTCSCGSGREKYAKYDGHGIFLTYVCEKCEDKKMQQYRPDINTTYEADEPIDDEPAIGESFYDNDFGIDEI